MIPSGAMRSEIVLDDEFSNLVVTGGGDELVPVWTVDGCEMMLSGVCGLA